MKASTQVSSIPFNNITDQSIQNPRGVDSNIIINQLELKYMKILGITYQDRKDFFNLFKLSSHEERVEHLLIHSYDIRIAERKGDRSMKNTKLVDLIEGNLHSTKDYLLAIQSLLDIPEMNTYLEKNVLIAPMDYPGQKNIRRAIVHRMINKEQSDVPPEILNIIPLIGPLHVSLNSWETVFLVNYDFFEKMYHSIFGSRKILAKKPKPYRINLLLELAFKGWLIVKESIENLFHNCKDPEVRIFIDLLDNIIPLVLDFYPKIFRGGYWETYKEAMFRVWSIFFRYRRKNYNKLPLAFFSDVFYWEHIQHPIVGTFENSLHIFNDYYVENFHSSIRNQTNSFNTAKQIICQARVIDQTRDKNSFIETFANHHNIVYTEKQLDFLEKKTAIFILDLFQDVWKNRGRVIKKKVKKYWQYKLPTLGKMVDQKVLPMAWNSSHQPRLDRICDRDMCTLSSDLPGIILSCGHGYHKECLAAQANQKCQYCFEYLCDGIRYHCSVFQNMLSKPFDDVVDEDGEDLENQQEDPQEFNGDEIISVEDDIDKKLEEALKLFELHQ